MVDYYEFLQISPHADADTIHRVYRFLAARLHPDNPESGDEDAFRTLKQAYDVLSNPVRRTEYNATRVRELGQITPFSTTVDFLDTVDGELNRRLAVLAVLYFRRREHPRLPEVTLAEIEKRMGFPRDYLDFTTWYLVKKGFITRADNSDFTLTADGVDFVETQRTQIPVLNRLLTSGRMPSAADFVSAQRTTASRVTPIVLPTSMGNPDRRVNSGDRRVNMMGRRATDRLQSA
jgi:curved DNA-binding protein CbpA